ncbi:hypothetical protein HAX54_022899 [Datura stramonium]|uniref:Uncharacterized protein n=1 Tax=Datura stramonium TaxID=4076 RepID=A0ABS8UVA6_DATST|nr:hypothetical protein [Datura stramonium]
MSGRESRRKRPKVVHRELHIADPLLRMELHIGPLLLPDGVHVVDQLGQWDESCQMSFVYFVYLLSLVGCVSGSGLGCLYAACSWYWRLRFRLRSNHRYRGFAQLSPALSAGHAFSGSGV